MIEFDFSIRMSGEITFDDANLNLKKFLDACKDLDGQFTIINDIAALRARVKINSHSEGKL